MCGRIPLDELEPAILGSIDPVDEMVMLHLRESLHGISDTPISALLERKLLPRHVTSALTDAELISRWLVLARSAQVLTGVPASILLAEIWHGARLGFGAFAPVVPGNDWFETGRNYASLGSALLDHAFYLQAADEFQPVMYARKNPKDYLAALGKCRLWDPATSLVLSGTERAWWQFSLDARSTADPRALGAAQTRELIFF
jgi:hypothetical protein